MNYTSIKNFLKYTFLNLNLQPNLLSVSSSHSPRVAESLSQPIRGLLFPQPAYNFGGGSHKVLKSR